MADVQNQRVCFFERGFDGVVCRDVSLKVAMAVIKMAHEEGQVGNDKALKALEDSDEELAAFIREHMYEPSYKPLVHLDIGVLE